MRRHDKKQNILEANLRLEGDFISNKNFILEINHTYQYMVLITYNQYNKL